jgi:hypothetical protein
MLLALSGRATRADDALAHHTTRQWLARLRLVGWPLKSPNCASCWRRALRLGKPSPCLQIVFCVAVRGELGDESFGAECMSPDTEVLPFCKRYRGLTATGDHCYNKLPSGENAASYLGLRSKLGTSGRPNRSRQLLLGRSKIESTVRYRGIDADDTLASASRLTSRPRHSL